MVPDNREQGSIHLRCKIGKICRWRIHLRDNNKKTADGRGVGVKNLENLTTSLMDGLKGKFFLHIAKFITNFSLRWFWMECIIGAHQDSYIPHRAKRTAWQVFWDFSCCCLAQIWRWGMGNLLPLNFWLLDTRAQFTPATLNYKNWFLSALWITEPVIM